jgi:hypothetical protein
MDDRKENARSGVRPKQNCHAGLDLTIAAIMDDRINKPGVSISACILQA